MICATLALHIRTARHPSSLRCGEQLIYIMKLSSQAILFDSNYDGGNSVNNNTIRNSSKSSNDSKNNYKHNKTHSNKETQA